MKRIQMIINTSTSGDPAEGYIVGSVTPSQNIVRLSGPESLIDQIDHVDAVASIDGYSSDINTNVELKLYDAQGNDVHIPAKSIIRKLCPGWQIFFYINHRSYII